MLKQTATWKATQKANSIQIRKAMRKATTTETWTENSMAYWTQMPTACSKATR